MSEPLTIYHNPRCTKSRDALALLREHHADLLVIEYLRSPPSAAEVVELAVRLGVSVRDIVRDNEEAYAAAGLDASSTDDELARAVAAHPILLQRPIVIRGDRGVVGRPPERVLELLK